jgi:hypothetical protein
VANGCIASARTSGTCTAPLAQPQQQMRRSITKDRTLKLIDLSDRKASTKKAKRRESEPLSAGESSGAAFAACESQQTG